MLSSMLRLGIVHLAFRFHRTRSNIEKVSCINVRRLLEGFQGCIGGYLEHGKSFRGAPPNDAFGDRARDCRADNMD